MLFICVRSKQIFSSISRKLKLLVKVVDFSSLGSLMLDTTDRCLAFFAKLLPAAAGISAAVWCGVRENCAVYGTRNFRLNFLHMWLHIIQSTIYFVSNIPV